MQVYVSNREIEQIAEGLVHVACGKPPPKRIDTIHRKRYVLSLNFRHSRWMYANSCGILRVAARISGNISGQTVCGKEEP